MALDTDAFFVEHRLWSIFTYTNLKFNWEIFHLCPNVAIFLKKSINFQGSDTIKKIILKGRGFRCGSDEKMMKMWFGLKIDVVGLPPLVK